MIQLSLMGERHSNYILHRLANSLAHGAGTVIAGLLLVSCSAHFPADKVLQIYDENQSYPELSIRSPLDESVFPPEIVAPDFAWDDAKTQADSWLILFQFQDGRTPLSFLSQRKEWTPTAKTWTEIKRRSCERTAKVTVLGLRNGSPPAIASRGQISIRTSRDEVGAALFYREVNLPFIEAVKDPSRIRWRCGTISSPQPPPVVLEHLPVCGNCHSFSQDGGVLGMDVDYANNKGSYVITRVAKQMSLATSEIISWDNYQKSAQQMTFGLLSQVSPDGQTVISTVKDKSVFVEKPDLAFSQLFFPIQGILVVYRRSSGVFQSLPGADDPGYVQSNPSWSPDGKYIVFARSKSYHLKNKGAANKVLLSPEDCAEFLRDGKPFLFDLYRIPYNNAQGGKPEPLAGASHNGRSNYFAKYSPDGKWIIFCQAKSYMLLQPDSELYIIPAEGGEPRRLRANTSRMNSWHSWSPNSRWLVFTSKVNSPYTQLFLTHIDPNGESSPPVLLAHFTAPDRAANIPEFVNLPSGPIVKIQEKFLNDNSYARAAYVFENTGAIDEAAATYQKALAINPKNNHAHQRLGWLLYNRLKRPRDGLAHTLEALRVEPNDACAHYDLGAVLMDQKQFDQAILHLTQALRLMPEGFDHHYNPADMHYLLGVALTANGQHKEATAILTKAVDLAPRKPELHYALALALAGQGMIEEPVRHYSIALSLESQIDIVPQYHLLMSVNYEKAGQFQQALASAQKALYLAQTGGDASLVRALQEHIEALRRKLGGNN